MERSGCAGHVRRLRLFGIAFRRPLNRVGVAVHRMGHDDREQEVIQDPQDETHANDFFRNHRRSLPQGQRSASSSKRRGRRGKYYARTVIPVIAYWCNCPVLVANGVGSKWIVWSTMVWKDMTTVRGAEMAVNVYL